MVIKTINKLSQDYEYIDENLLKDFLNLVSTTYSLSAENKIYIDFSELLKVFHIKSDPRLDDFPDALLDTLVEDLIYILKKINKRNLGVVATKAISYDGPLSDEQVEDIYKFKNPTLNLRHFCFEINRKAFEKTLHNFKEAPHEMYSNTKGETRNHLVSKDKQGNFFYNDKLVEFNDKNNIYAKILNILYEQADGDEFCSYAKINQELIKSGEHAVIEQKKIVERISNGVKNLFRYTRIAKRTPDGKKLIDVSKGRGLIFHNPPIR